LNGRFRRSPVALSVANYPFRESVLPDASVSGQTKPRERTVDGLRATDANANGGACRPFLFPPGSGVGHKLTTHAARVATLQRAPADEINSYRLYCPLFAMHEQKPISYGLTHRSLSPVQTPSATARSTYCLLTNCYTLLREKILNPLILYYYN
jgi:hypothetical protein